MSFLVKICFDCKQEVEGLKARILDNLRWLTFAPGVQMDNFPPAHLVGVYDTDLENTNTRLNQYIRQHSILKDDFEDHQIGMQ